VPKAFYRRLLPHLQPDCKPHLLTTCHSVFTTKIQATDERGCYG